MRRILTVCTGNICRSPLAAFALADLLPDREVSSAGLHALVGRDVDPEAADAGAKFDIPIRPHSARQFGSEIARSSDLILVMEAHHRHEIANRWPQFVGKTFLLGHFNDARDVPDPYKSGLALHLRAAEMIRAFSGRWAEQIKAL